MSFNDAMLLALAGWTIESEKPYEIRHADGSFATGRAAQLVRRTLKQAYTNATANTDKNVQPLQADSLEARASELRSIAQRLCAHCEQAQHSRADSFAWERAYALIFSAQGSQRVRQLVTTLGLPLDWDDAPITNFDIDYEDECLGYVAALRDTLSVLDGTDIQDIGARSKMIPHLV